MKTFEEWWRERTATEMPMRAKVMAREAWEASLQNTRSDTDKLVITEPNLPVEFSLPSTTERNSAQFQATLTEAGVLRVMVLNGRGRLAIFPHTDNSVSVVRVSSKP